MSYVNTKHKIRTIFTAAQQNRADLDTLAVSNDKVLEQLKKVSIYKFNFNKIHDFSSEWENTEVLSIDILNDYNHSDGSYSITKKYAAYKEWQVEVDNIPEKYLPFLDYKMEVQTNAGIDLTNNFQTTSILQKISEKEGIYNIILIAGMSTNFLDDEVSLKTRLLVKIHNPEIYR
jgi:hypothetical protein